MRQLAEDGSYEITEEMRERLSDFYGGYAEEQETFDKIRSLYEDTGYVIDTHTAVAAAVYDRYQEETGDRTPAVIASTASPFKFARSVMTAIDPRGRSHPRLLLRIQDQWPSSRFWRI